MHADLGRPTSTAIVDRFADPATSAPRWTIASTCDALGRLQSASEDLDAQSATYGPQTVRYTNDLLGNVLRTELPAGMTSELTCAVRNRCERLTRFATVGTLAERTCRWKLVEFTSTSCADVNRPRTDEVFWLEDEKNPTLCREWEWPVLRGIDEVYDENTRCRRLR